MMKRTLLIVWSIALAISFAHLSQAAEEIDKVIEPVVSVVEETQKEVVVPFVEEQKIEAPQSAAQEVVPQAMVPLESIPSDKVKASIEEYIKGEMAEAGVFDVYDPDKEETRELSFDAVHDKVSRSGEYYFACVDFTDKNSTDKVDLDFDVEETDGQFDVVDVRIHKVNGVPRYSYDDQNNRVPIMDSDGAQKIIAPEDSMMEDLKDSIDQSTKEVTDDVLGAPAASEANTVTVPAEPVTK